METKTAPFSLDDIIQASTLHGRMMRLFLVGEEIAHSRIIGLGLVGALLVFAASAVDGVLLLGSVTRPLGDDIRILGMSLSGDTMVWPFCLLVPLAIFLTLHTAKTAIAFLNRVAQSDRIEQADQAQLHARTRDFLRGHLFGGISIFWFCWAVSILFYFYNSTFCGLADLLPDDLYPYRTNEIETVAGAFVNLAEPVLLPKWDCSLHAAPAANVAARAWALFFYTAPPLIFGYLVSLIAGVCFFLSRALDEKQEGKISAEKHLPLDPFDSDPHGGLGDAANVGMAFFYTASIFMFMVFMSMLKEATPPSWHNFALILFLIPLTLACLAVPSDYVRKFIHRAKKTSIDIVSSRAEQEISKLISSEGRSDSQVDYERLQALNMLHTKLQSVRVWPFESSVLVKVILTLSVPAISVLIELF